MKISNWAPIIAVTESHSVFVPNLYNLRVSGNNEVQLFVEVERLDWQVVEVVFNQNWLAWTQVIEQYLQEKTRGISNTKI